MKLGMFEMRIVGGNEAADGYVGLMHGQQYPVELCNHGPRACDVELTIDGVAAGVFRLNGNTYCRIEHPVHDLGHFTFFELATPDAHSAGLKSNDEMGLVKAVFMPEWVQPAGVLFSSPTSGFDVTVHDLAVPNLAPGGTGLTGESQQNYGSARAIRRAGESEFVTIHLRLGGKSHTDIRPLTGTSLSNPVPPPLS